MSESLYNIQNCFDHIERSVTSAIASADALIRRERERESGFIRLLKRLLFIPDRGSPEFFELWALRSLLEDIAMRVTFPPRGERSTRFLPVVSTQNARHWMNLDAVVRVYEIPEIAIPGQTENDDTESYQVGVVFTDGTRDYFRGSDGRKLAALVEQSSLLPISEHSPEALVGSGG